MLKIWFTEINPDKGTETKVFSDFNYNINNKFTEINPDKGTETLTD